MLAVTYVGGQVAQTTVHIPNSTAGIFQAMMLFFILASDILVRYRVRLIPAPARRPPWQESEMSVDFLIAAFITVVGLTTPILLAGLGELVVEKSGVLNLGVEGMMLIGAISGFGVTVMTCNPWLACLGAAAGGALSAMLFGVLVLQLNSNQVATGLALTIFGTGLSSLLGLSLHRPDRRAVRLDLSGGAGPGPHAEGDLRLFADRLFRAGHGAACRLVPEIDPGRADPARGGRERPFGPFDRLFGGRRALCRHRLRRRDGGHRRRLFLAW